MKLYEIAIAKIKLRKSLYDGKNTLYLFNKYFWTHIFSRWKSSQQGWAVPKTRGRKPDSQGWAAIHPCPLTQIQPQISMVSEPSSICHIHSYPQFTQLSTMSTLILSWSEYATLVVSHLSTKYDDGNMKILSSTQ